MKGIILFALSVVLLMLVACGPSSETLRQKDVPDLGWRWNDNDSKQVAASMIKDVLSRPWYSEHMKATSGKKPVVIVGSVRVMGTEHIATDTFINDIERELTNSGMVTFVVSKGERVEIRDERIDQQTNSSAATAKKLAQETGADYMLQGTINTTTNTLDNKQTIVYQTDLQLVNLQSNEKVWIGTDKINKFTTKNKFK